MKFDDLYLDYKDEELEVKMALESTGVDSKVAAEAAKQYQIGKAQDLIYAEKALAAGATFNTVNKVISANVVKRMKARPEFDDKLRKALIKAGKLPDLVNDYQAHHIVAKGARRAKKAISILKALGIDIDDPSNGIFLPASEKDKRQGSRKSAYVHNKVHTNIYYANVTFEVLNLFEQNLHRNESEQKQGMIDLLKRIGEQLQSGKYPLYQYIPGAEQFDR